MSDYGTELKRLREEADFTQAALASRVGVSPSAIRSYESGARMPKLDTQMKIVKEISDVLSLLGDRHGNEIDTSSLLPELAQFDAQTDLANVAVDFTWNGKRVSERDMGLIRAIMKRLYEEE